ncbi:Hydroxyacylglutathione hydrolase [hydrothermal vent metagenome]|uniref:hydroxyacylglutathione hydrolase n=1 Tax=hydrothermal vent metagenome TaxID=652676 RepID=A0A3B0TC49_9ZZZZ
MADLEIFQFPCLSDNYGVLLHDPDTGATASIDAPDADAVSAALAQKGWTLTQILVTHHHWDHTQGIPALVEQTGCKVIGPAAEGANLTGLDTALDDGEVYDFAGHGAKIIATPGHTLGSICYWFEADRLLFSGDTLFAMGCGRIFEGTPAQMWASMERLRALPIDTRIYCGHEYTQANAQFALSVEPGNEALKVRAAAVEKYRAQGRATVPTSMALELATNPFLRPDSSEIQQNVGLVGAPLGEVFAATRARKDSF